jgi:hypothetical protein
VGPAKSNEDREDEDAQRKEDYGEEFKKRRHQDSAGREAGLGGVQTGVGDGEDPGSVWRREFALPSHAGSASAAGRLVVYDFQARHSRINSTLNSLRKQGNTW